MDKSAIVAKLREHESELKAAGVEHLFLHGSYARGTAIREVSDVDVITVFTDRTVASRACSIRLTTRSEVRGKVRAAASACDVPP